MFNFIERMSYEQMAWFTVVVYILHFAEEGPRLVKWFNTYLPRKVRKFLPYSQLKLNMENIILFAHVLVIAILINIYPGNWILQGLVLASGVGHIQNTVFHAVPTLYTGVYSPGLVSSCMLNPPLLWILLWKADQTGILTMPVVTMALVAGLLALPAAVLFTHKILLRGIE